MKRAVQNHLARTRSGLFVGGMVVAALGLLCGHRTAAQDMPDSSSYYDNIEREADYRARRAYELRRAAAHARMPDTMYASTPSLPDAPHAAEDVTGKSPARQDYLATARAVLAATRSRVWLSSDEETAEDVFRENISPIVQDVCIECHVEGGQSGHTPLVFTPSSQDHHDTVNLQVFEDYLAVKDDGANVILNKIRGVGHGGGIRVPYGSEEYRHFERFLALLGGEVDDTGSDLTADALFDGVGMASGDTVLRRAALIFAGRVPTPDDYASLAEDGLRTAVRNLMEDYGFHDFLITAANDRLLTDREHNVVPSNDHGPFVAFVNKTNEFCEAAAAGADDREWQDWDRAVQHAAARAPLELIAHVVENERSYTEILTADYIMANPQAAEAYGADTEFDDPTDVFEFQESKFASYYLVDDSRIFREAGWDCPQYIVHPGDLAVPYPHSGILNSTVFMRRYPTTATNRNRARSRWTYYHFLGLDVEKSATRTTDAEALKDTNNPTLNNGACTVCHQRLDPVAGTFQNYDEEGHYRSAHGGGDSLDGDYKENPPGGADVLVEARSWDDREIVATDGYLVAGDNTIGLRAVAEDDHVNLGLDLLTVRDEDDRIVDRRKLSRRDNSHCGERDGAFYRLYPNCILGVSVSVPQAGTYTVEVEAWAWEEDRRYPVRLRLWAPGYIYEEGDTWYRDMRPPGYRAEQAPDADNSVRWLAEQIIADEAFAESTVKFWWPAIHGREILGVPDEEEDVDFAGIDLAATAQEAEVKRLASAFATGFGDGSPFNLKDLLVEMVLSKWFRAETIPDDHPDRTVALLHAGAKRLLTPEELARKTLDVTGVQWGREWRQPWHDLRERHTALTHTYGTLYGGIDSDGIIERAGDMNAVMAGVAKRHAVEVSCPVVLREFYLLPDDQRLLFDGIDHHVTPMSEFGQSFEIAATSDADPDTLAVTATLQAGGKTLRLTFENDYYSESETADRNVRLDRLTVRNVDEDSDVLSYEFENHSGGSCGEPDGDHYLLWGGGTDCALEVPFDLPADGTHDVEIVAWADQAGDRLAQLHVELESTDGNSIGAGLIRDKLVDLHDRLLGVRVGAESTDVSSAYDLFVDVWNRKLDEEDGDFFSIQCDWNRDHLYLQGILEDSRVRHRHHNGGWQYDWNWDRINEFWADQNISDPDGVAKTWTVVLMGLLMDQRYLHL